MKGVSETDLEKKSLEDAEKGIVLVEDPYTVLLEDGYAESPTSEISEPHKNAEVEGGGTSAPHGGLAVVDDKPTSSPSTAIESAGALRREELIKYLLLSLWYMICFFVSFLPTSHMVSQS